MSDDNKKKGSQRRRGKDSNSGATAYIGERKTDTDKLHKGGEIPPKRETNNKTDKK